MDQLCLLESLWTKNILNTRIYPKSIGSHTLKENGQWVYNSLMDPVQERFLHSSTKMHRKVEASYSILEVHKRIVRETFGYVTLAKKSPESGILFPDYGPRCPRICKEMRSMSTTWIRFQCPVHRATCSHITVVFHAMRIKPSWSLHSNVWPTIWL